MYKYLIAFFVSLVVFGGIFKTQQYFKGDEKDDKDKKKTPTTRDYIVRVFLPSIVLTAIVVMFEGSFTLPSWLGGGVDEPTLDGDYFERRGGPSIDE